MARGPPALGFGALGPWGTKGPLAPLGSGPLARGALGLLARGRGGERGALGPGGPWPARGALGPGGPWPGGPLARGALGPGGPWPGGPLARGALGPGGPWPGGPLARGALGPGGPWPGGPLARGALGPGGPWPGGPLARGALGREGPLARGHEIEQPACLDPLASLLVQESSHQGPGGPGQGVPANPEPKTLNRPPEAKGYDLGLYFSYAKGGLGAGHPLAEY